MANRRQLEFSSNYKSEFLANVSHELRTPLNSLLILAQLLTENAEGNLSAKQVEYASTIYSSGNDLLYLISDILDLSKIELGKMEIVPGEVTLSDIQEMIESHFQPIARYKGLPFEVRIQTDMSQILLTDEQRLLQVLKNLLANAFKFTHHGQITLRVQATERKGQEMVAFAVEDTGIGIPLEKMQQYTKNYLAAGGQKAFSEYYTAQADEVQFHPSLIENVVFAQHNLVTDRSFNEFHVIMCRNVMIYFDGQLQNRVHHLFYESLCPGGLFALGNREGIRFTSHANSYEELDAVERIYLKIR